MIVRRQRRDRFTIVDNGAIEDDRLSFKALGLLAYLLSRPDGWRASYRQLATVRRDGEASVRSALKELELAGYMTRTRMRCEGGKFTWVSVVQETPCGGFPGVDKPGVENRRSKQRRNSKDPLTPIREKRHYDSEPLTPEEIAAKYGCES